MSDTLDDSDILDISDIFVSQPDTLDILDISDTSVSQYIRHVRHPYGAATVTILNLNIILITPFFPIPTFYDCNIFLILPTVTTGSPCQLGQRTEAVRRLEGLDYSAPRVWWLCTPLRGKTKAQGTRPSKPEKKGTHPIRNSRGIAARVGQLLSGSGKALDTFLCPLHELGLVEGERM